MKTKKLILAFLGVAILTLALPTFTGCAFLKRQLGTETTQRTTYNTIWSLASGVDTAYRGYVDLVISGKLSTNSFPKVSGAYGGFQTSLNAALILVVGNTNAVPPQTLVDSAVNFNTTVGEAKKGTP